ncbi:MAG: bifunctional 5,10-methylenetetrahydrofolate dehydrogenase/5,10-methenyltetrahydrofolate cyclohydrolase [bacterium]|nr:bifunctional 5,10-methylenetetrahydrofolate dehydrogenase/5,10-methenyltetrahydrofolate cyclohydrolase [bacterium]
MIIDGKAIAEEMYKALKERRTHFARGIKIGIIVVGVNPVIESFVRIKTRAAQRLNIEMVRVDLLADAGTQKVIEAVEKLASDTDAVIVQLPLPRTIDSDTVLSAIPKEKDVDALNPTIPYDKHSVFAPVALAVVEILKRSSIPIKGARTVVVGAGRLVGAPSAHLLKRLGARVSMFTLQEGSMNDLKDADIVVCGAGNPGFIKPEHLKDGVALVDAGASESKGKVVGDADPACAERASVFTPVPGGVGPVAVAMIFRNLFDLLDKKS